MQNYPTPPETLILTVSIQHQTLSLVRDRHVLHSYPVSTASAGAGNREGSGTTPTGNHQVCEIFGKHGPIFQVFESRQPTGEFAKPGAHPQRDLILSRILWLEGLEPGHNAGPDIDSKDRYIYIHGTNQEDRIGTPASAGCIRMRNQDIVELTDQYVETGMECRIVA